MDLLLEDNAEGVKLSWRDAPPNDYIFKIHSFSSLFKSFIEKFDSAVSDSGGYKWQLSLYPKGDGRKKARDHISLLLTIVHTESLPFGWGVNVILRFFVFNQIRDKYAMLQVGSEGKFKRFNGQKTEWGISQLLTLGSFNDPNNGFLVDDTGVFGVEICSGTQTECLSMVKDATSVKHTWKVKNLSNLTGDESWYSDMFIAGGYQWKMHFFPNGYSEGKNNSISLFLRSDETLNPGQKIYTAFSLRVMDQKLNKHVVYKCTDWFSASGNERGWYTFIGIERFRTPENGFLVKDECVIDAEVTVLGFVNKLT